MAPKSFIARRGQVKDNGTNFTLAEKKLCFMITACNQKKIHDLFLRNDIKRNFNSPTPLNHGGLKEKFIRDNWLEAWLVNKFYEIFREIWVILF